MLHKQGN